MKKKVDNVFLKHIEEDHWHDIRVYHIENEIIWRNAAIIMLFMLVSVVIIAMYFVNEDKHKTIVYEKDDRGNLTLLGIANKTFNVDNKIIAQQLASFIVALREVPLDINIRRRNIKLVHSFVDAKLISAINKMIIEQYNKVKDDILYIELLSIKPLAGNNSWVISWKEITNKNEISYWSTTVTFNRFDAVDKNIQLFNPIGLIIKYINPVMDINSK
jgi:type IV secretory pathway TrbF-like protein